MNHGTNSTYCAGRCRCDDCTEAHRVVNARARIRARKNGDAYKPAVAHNITDQPHENITIRGGNIPLPGDWAADAACYAPNNANTPMFFPATGGTNNSDQAKTVCNSCPVKSWCLGYALAHPAIDGVWGGTTKKERVRIRARRTVAA